MKKYLLFFPCFFFTFSLPAQKTSTEQFGSDLEFLQDYFHIPGMSAIVKKGDDILFEKYYGYADLEKKVPIDANTIFPLASLTKIFAATLIFQLEEEGLLSLEDPMKKYFPNADIPSSIKLKQVLSHTSQGKPGEQFFYSFRFGFLTQVIEQASGRSFAQLLQEKIIEPLNIKHEVLLSGEKVIEELGNKLAQPYLFQGQTEPGRFEPGFSASAGLMMTARELLLFDEAFNRNKLLSKKSKKKMFRPFYQDAPYGLGIFTQAFLGKKLVWGYGQYDCFSSLYLKVPEEDLTLVLLANNNLMSDPARLIYGDVTYSLFALSFLKNFVFQNRDPGYEDIGPNGNLSDVMVQLSDDEKSTAIIRQQLLAWGLAKSFMGQAFEDEKTDSWRCIYSIIPWAPDYEKYGNLSLMHALIMNLDNKKDQQKEKELLGEMITKIGKKLLAECPENPYANLYLGEYYAHKGESDQALVHFKTIVDAKNYERFWYTEEASNFIRSYKP